MLVFNLIAFFFKNLALVVGVVEAIIKLLAGLASLSATKADDDFVAGVNTKFSEFKKFFYDISDVMANKKPEG